VWKAGNAERSSEMQIRQAVQQDSADRVGNQGSLDREYNKTVQTGRAIREFKQGVLQDSEDKAGRQVA
jgi:hypothetical protein